MDTVIPTTQKEDLESQREEIERVQTMLVKALGAFRRHSAIDVYMEQFHAKTLVPNTASSLLAYRGLPNSQVQKSSQSFWLDSDSYGELPGLGRRRHSLHQSLRPSVSTRPSGGTRCVRIRFWVPKKYSTALLGWFRWAKAIATSLPMTCGCTAPLSFCAAMHSPSAKRKGKAQRTLTGSSRMSLTSYFHLASAGISTTLVPEAPHDGRHVAMTSQRV